MEKDQPAAKREPREKASDTGHLSLEQPILAVALEFLETGGGQVLNMALEVQADGADSIHRMRTATRQLCSALDFYRKLFDASTLDALEHELRWLARILGAPRDAEVLRERLEQRILELSAPLHAWLGSCGISWAGSLQTVWRGLAPGGQRLFHFERGRV